MSSRVGGRFLHGAEPGSMIKCHRGIRRKPALWGSPPPRAWSSAASSAPACSRCRPCWPARAPARCSSLAVIALGAMVLAVLFGQLTKRVPNSDGGLYAYARHEFGDFAGYLTGWCYWVQAWAGNAAIVSAWVLYVDALFGISHPSA